MFEIFEEIINKPEQLKDKYYEYYGKDFKMYPKCYKKISYKDGILSYVKIEKDIYCSTIIFFENGLAHAKCHPAVTKQYLNGHKTEIWYNNGYIHKNNGPAKKKFNQNNKLIYELYCYNGYIHNLDGPAAINYNNNELKYFIFGKEYSELQWLLAREIIDD